jgi:hypothetical protein
MVCENGVPCNNNGQVKQAAGGMNSRITMRDISKSVAPDSPGELEVLGHDRDSAGVDGAQVGVLEQRHEVGLSSLLEGENGRRLESQFLLELVGELTDWISESSTEPLEGQLPDEQVS